MSFDSKLSEDARKYLEDKKVPQLIEHLFHELAVSMPNDPLSHLQKILAKAPKPRVTILGSPLSGKSTLAKTLGEKYQVPVLNLEELLAQNSDVAQKVTGATSSRAADTITGKLVAQAASKAAESEGGWILDGFPRTRNEAIELQSAGVLPSLVVVLDAAEQICESRVTNEMDLAALNGRRRLFQFNRDEVYQCYPKDSLRVHVDANGSQEEVVNEVDPKVDAVCS